MDNRRYTGRERRQRMLLRLSVVLWVAACCLALCGKAAGPQYERDAAAALPGLPEDQCCELYEAGDFKTRFEYSDNRKRG